MVQEFLGLVPIPLLLTGHQILVVQLITLLILITMLLQIITTLNYAGISDTTSLNFSTILKPHFLAPRQ